MKILGRLFKYEEKLGFNKLTIDDFINIRRRDSDKKACVNIGDLISVKIDSEEIIGIVLHIDDKTMKIQNSIGEIKWMSLYVIYEVLQYNNKKGDTNASKEENYTDKERKT